MANNLCRQMCTLMTKFFMEKIKKRKHTYRLKTVFQRNLNLVKLVVCNYDCVLKANSDPNRIFNRQLIETFNKYDINLFHKHERQFIQPNVYRIIDNDKTRISIYATPFSCLFAVTLISKLKFQWFVQLNVSLLDWECRIFFLCQTVRQTRWMEIKD